MLVGELSLLECWLECWHTLLECCYLCGVATVGVLVGVLSIVGVLLSLWSCHCWSVVTVGVLSLLECCYCCDVVTVGVLLLL